MSGVWRERDRFPDDRTGEVKDLRAEVLALKELVADLSLENRLLKKHERGHGIVRHWSEDNGVREVPNEVSRR